MDIGEQNHSDDHNDGEDARFVKNARGIGKLDSDLDTEEEGDDELGFEIADDDEDNDNDAFQDL